MRVVCALAVFALIACSDSSNAQADPQGLGSSRSPSGSPFIETESGRYEVALNQGIDLKSLPSNADLKMVDGDIVEYARTLCGIDYANEMRPDQCDIYVQSDPTGLLIGYVTILQGQGVRIETAIETDRKRGGLGCFINGELENTDFEQPDAALDASKDFEARLFYTAWEKNPGDWMVSFNDDSIDSQGAGGMWYAKRVKNKLRISQERWSYCYSGSDIYIDEVFERAVTLKRVSE